jgi:hypothetical protein
MTNANAQTAKNIWKLESSNWCFFGFWSLAFVICVYQSALFLGQAEAKP